MTRMHTLTDTALGWVREDLDKLLEQMRLQTENLANLIDDLFELSQLETGQVQLEMQAVNLNDLLSDVVEGSLEEVQEKVLGHLEKLLD